MDCGQARELEASAWPPPAKSRATIPWLVEQHPVFVAVIATSAESKRQNVDKSTAMFGYWIALLQAKGQSGCPKVSCGKEGNCDAD